MRDMRSSELSESSQSSSCFRLGTGLALLTGALASLSESLESNEGAFLDALLDGGLGLENASRMHGCFASMRNEERKNRPCY